MKSYFASGDLNTGKFLTTFLISYLLECEGLKKDDIDENGNHLTGKLFNYVGVNVEWCQNIILVH